MAIGELLCLTGGLEAIHRCIPHRAPFLLIDRIVECVPLKSARVTRQVTRAEPLVAGRDGTTEVMPSTLIVEAVAQACGVLCYCSGHSPEGANMLLAAIREAKFHRDVMPGDELTIDVVLRRAVRDIAFYRGTVSVGGELVAEVELAAAVKSSGGPAETATASPQ
jgi:3-hydroxyacyl-[acyl-carrier-protein] dehydratase